MTRRELTSVEARLRYALETPAPVREGVDMSAAAITGRLRDACELSSLCLALGEVRVPAEPAR